MRFDTSQTLENRGSELDILACGAIARCKSGESILLEKKYGVARRYHEKAYNRGQRQHQKLNLSAEHSTQNIHSLFIHADQHSLNLISS